MMKSSVSVWLIILIKIWILNVKSMMVVNVLVVLTIVHVMYPQLNIWSVLQVFQMVIICFL